MAGEDDVFEVACEAAREVRLGKCRGNKLVFEDLGNAVLNFLAGAAISKEDLCGVLKRSGDRGELAARAGALLYGMRYVFFYGEAPDDGKMEAMGHAVAATLETMGDDVMEALERIVMIACAGYGTGANLYT